MGRSHLSPSVIFFRVSKVSERFLHRWWFNSMQWTTPLEVIRSILLVRFTSTAFSLNDTISFLQALVKDLLVFSGPIRAAKDQYQFQAQVNPHAKSSLFYDLYSRQTIDPYYWTLFSVNVVESMSKCQTITMNSSYPRSGSIKFGWLTNIPMKVRVS